jgi:hypothetical protein
MTLRSEIFAWSTRQPRWRRDLMRRLAHGPVLGAEDEEAVLQMLLAEHAGRTAPFAPKPLALDDLPRTGKEGDVLVVSVSELLNVNGLAEGQKLAFGPRLNIVYGPNGSGKTGYGRIFKRSCRAVDDEPVRGNVYTNDTTPPQATITIATKTGEEAIRVDLTRNGPAALSSVMVFDGRCASIYATAETVAFTPTTLRIFDRVATAQTKLRTRLDARIDELARERPSFGDITPGTEARLRADGLARETDLAALEGFARLDADAKARLADLEVALAKLQTAGPEALAARAEREAELVAQLLGRLQHVEDALGVATAERLEGARAAAETTKAAVDAAAAAFASEPLAATGSAGWLTMWNAARNFLEHDCHAIFPPSAGEVCPVCQQMIEDEASDRLARLERFVKSTVERDAAEASKTLEASLATLEELRVAELAHHAGLSVLELEEPATHTFVLAFIDAACGRVSALARGAATAPPVVDLGALQAFVATRRVQATAQRALIDPARQRALATERDELRARERLAARLGDVRAWHAALAEAAVLERARRALDTTAITRKQSELAKVAVSDALRARLAAELEAFGFDDLRVDVSCRGHKGVTRMRAALRGCDETPDHVLCTSEGRAVALAFFLAEIACSEHTAPIVVDDPTSSFDQEHRRHFARRLITESRRRQTIVLTHDLALVYELESRAEAAGIECNSQALRKVGGRPGITDPELPWVATGVKGRRSLLNARMQKLAKMHRLGDPEYEHQARLTAELVRETWERALEERALNGGVTRFEPAIQTKRLTKSALDPDVIRRFDEGMTETSQWVHDQPRGGHATAPTPKELTQALNHLDEFLQALAAR